MRSTWSPRKRATIPPRSPSSCRDLAVLEVLYGAGLRVSECCGLRVADCDLDRGLVTVLGKGSKVRRVPLGDPAVDALAAWLERGRPDARDARLAGRPRVPQPARPCTDAPRRPPGPRAAPAPRRAHPPPARAPARLRHAPARRRSRPPSGPGAPRPRRSGDHPDLHSCHPRPAASRLRSDAPPCLTTHDRQRGRRALDRLQVERHVDRARAPDPPLLAAREVRRRPRRRRSAAEHRAVRPRELRDLRAHRRDRQVRSRPRLQVRDLRDLPHQGRDHRRAALDRLGAALGAGQGAVDRAGVLEARERAAPQSRGRRGRGRARHDRGRARHDPLADLLRRPRRARRAARGRSSDRRERPPSATRSPTASTTRSRRSSSTR